MSQIQKEKLQSSKALAEELVAKLLQDFDVQAGETYGMLINGLGATPTHGAICLCNDVAQLLADKQIKVVYHKIGNYMTSIDMAGLSLTFNKLADASWLEALEASVETPAW
ncbi:dihydroxyacetone kinase subunit DhaK [Streptococcus sp. O1]|nr:dihydroxyacetone kinase subunit DhaK [Streptococcus sp. O1]